VKPFREVSLVGRIPRQLRHMYRRVLKQISFVKRNLVGRCRRRLTCSSMHLKRLASATARQRDDP